MKRISHQITVFLLFIFCAGFFSSAAGQDGAEYLPLAKGKKWVLRSPAMKEPVILEVLERTGDSFRLRFDNPWVHSEMMLTARQGQYYVTEVTMSGQSAPLPKGTLYFDLTAPEGKTWSNQIGTLTVVSRNKTIKTASQTYRDCIQIREVNKEGNQLYWTFARGVGFVQFGEGSGAFVLESAGSSGRDDSVDTGAGARPGAGASASSPFRAGKLRIGLSANTFANEPFNSTTVMARFNQSLQAGVTYLYLSPKWNELEVGHRKYNWKDIDFQINQSIQANLPAVCNLRIVDTNNRAFPDDLKRLSFRDPKVQRRLLALLDALLPRFKNRVHLMLVGNEIDSYFREHRKEAGDYRDLFAAAADRIKSANPRIQVSASVTFDGLDLLDNTLAPVFERSDFLALTYYPMNPDFTFRNPDGVSRDFSRIVSTARGKKILLQEVGYSSSALNNSSEEKQARFYANVFRSLRANADSFYGANFLFMSDLPDSVVDSLAQYYKLPNADRFKAFLRTLGIFDQNGRPKKSWNVFREEAVRIKEGKP